MHLNPSAKRRMVRSIYTPCGMLTGGDIARLGMFADD
ncbi:protein of unknown function [Hyphomicrobium sp. 1Nfss2.1]